MVEWSRGVLSYFDGMLDNPKVSIPSTQSQECLVNISFLDM